MGGKRRRQPRIKWMDWVAAVMGKLLENSKYYAGHIPSGENQLNQSEQRGL